MLQLPKVLHYHMRLSILIELAEHPLLINKISEMTTLDYSAVRNNMQQLLRSQLVSQSNAGFYAITDKGTNVLNTLSSYIDKKVEASCND